MKLSTKTLEILNNFSGIYNSIYFQDGSEQRVYPTSQTILAIANIEEKFPKKFAIADLKQFLSLISIMKDPILEFHDNYLIMGDDIQKVKYRFSAPNLVNHIDKAIKTPESYETFTLTEETLVKFAKAAAILSSEYIAFAGDGQKLIIRTFDGNDEEKSSASFELSETDKKFKAVLKYDVVCNKMISDSYTVTLGKNKLMSFKAQSRELEYFVPCEAKTTELE